jgi:hypothetical protein
VEVTTAKFELLKLELQSIQAGIRGMDTIMFQIKGWCVTVAVATAGFALTSSHIELVAVGGAAVVGFWLVDAHYKSIQRVFIDRNNRIEEIVAGQDPITALNMGHLRVPELGFCFRGSDQSSYWKNLKNEFGRLWREARIPLTFGLYLFILALLGGLALVDVLVR